MFFQRDDRDESWREKFRRFAHDRHPGHGHGHGHGRHEHGRHERGERGGPGMHFGRGGRLARFLEHGDLKLLVLHLIAERPRHGYEIIKAIEDMAGGAYSPSPGVIYPTLTLLEELGQVTATAEGSRKRYAVTEDGARALEESKAMVAAMLARIGDSQPRETALPVMRAMENLRTALRLKLGRGGAAAETMGRIADVLDACAKQIEGI